MKHIVKMLTIVSMTFLSAGCGRTSEPLSTISKNSSADDISSMDNSGFLSSNSNSDDTLEKNNIHIDYDIFKGMPKSENPLNTVNRKDFRPSLLCYGGGNTFFMWDGTVYRHNGETTEALFEKNVYDLNYYDEMLYFIENDQYDFSSLDQVHIEGTLYRYNLNNGETDTLIGYPVSLPAVGDGEIFFTSYATAGDPEPTGIYCVDKDGNSERLYNGLKFIEYGEYHLKFDWSDGEKAYFSREDKSLLLENVHPYWDCVVGDHYYYRSRDDNSLNRLSLINGEIEALPTNTENGFICLDYTVLNDDIYLIDGQSSLLKYNFETDSYTPIACKYAFRYIYADENSIYGVGCEREEQSINHTFHFVKLTIDGDTAKGEILA